MYNLNDLQQIKIKAGNLEGFQNSWIMVTSNMRKLPEIDILEDCYYEAIKGYPGLSEDMAHYNRLDEGSGGDRTFDYLYNSVNRYLARKKQDRNRNALSKSVLTSTQPALTASQKKAGGGKGAGKKGNAKGGPKGGDVKLLKVAIKAQEKVAKAQKEAESLLGSPFA